MAKPGILVVEDEKILALDLKMIIEDSGWRLTGIVSSGEDAIDGMRKDRPDLVLMDIKLEGGMDGIEAAEKIREEFDIPLVFITGNVDGNTVERAKKVGPAGFISKPLDMNKLTEMFEKILKA
jgi:CheY-like chemotaxis protein